MSVMQSARSFTERERKTAKLTIFLLCLLIAVVVFWHYGDPLLRSRLIKQSDGLLAIELYGIGSAFVLLGVLVSICPPKTMRWKLASLAAFPLVFYVGFLVTSEQARRASKSSLDAENARTEDAKNKVIYDADVKRLEAKIDDTRDTIAIFAKNSPDSARWNALASDIDKIRLSPPVSQTLVISPVSSGNLRERATDLSKEILDDLYLRGDPSVRPAMSGKSVIPRIGEMPTDVKKMPMWNTWLSEHFKSRQRDRVVAIMKEFSELHLKDERLDQIMASDGMWTKDVDYSRSLRIDDIEDVARILQAFADEIKEK